MAGNTAHNQNVTDPTPMWLADCLERALPDAPHHERDQLAYKILAAMPQRKVVVAIRESCATVLRQRGIRDAAGDLAREIANNATQSVVFALADDEHVSLRDAEAA